MATFMQHNLISIMRLTVMQNINTLSTKTVN